MLQRTTMTMTMAMIAVRVLPTVSHPALYMYRTHTQEEKVAMHVRSQALVVMLTSAPSLHTIPTHATTTAAIAAVWRERYLASWMLSTDKRKIC